MITNNKNTIMKKILIALACTFTIATAMGQTGICHPLASYEAAGWKTWLIDESQVSIPPAPTTAQTKSELQSLKKKLHNPDEKASAEIAYWNAGAPSSGGTR